MHLKKKKKISEIIAICSTWIQEYPYTLSKYDEKSLE
jgi:hypothetical protein